MDRGEYGAAYEYCSMALDLAAAEIDILHGCLGVSANHLKSYDTAISHLNLALNLTLDGTTHGTLDSQSNQILPDLGFTMSLIDILYSLLSSYAYARRIPECVELTSRSFGIPSSTARQGASIVLALSFVNIKDQITRHRIEKIDRRESELGTLQLKGRSLISEVW